MATFTPYTDYSSTTGGGFDSSDKIHSSDGSEAINRNNSLTPVTIKQITESKQLVQDGPFVIHNQELNHISFVGVVRNITDHTSNIFLTIEDGTGQIDVRKWSDDSNDISTSQDDSEKAGNSQIAQQYKVGSYVKVHGALKEFGGKKNVQYAVIRTVDSFNEVITHHLEVIKCHAIAMGKMQNPSGEAVKDTQEEGKSLFVSENSNSGDTAQEVLAFCRKKCEGQDANQFAVPTALIAQSLNISEDQARRCCTQLIEQGYIYPTFDDDHYFAL
ncbi:hypothetical protein TBLA_0A07750 [Henningerozyma blattae CBS 6284]|uniref:Replication protein A C-terminal domain-containing protein n=1 Tax=Henningerozyma blattae (strain ATCC 34711 / CBS 6284 / DSM 70876 / NBRC 10599 / NRRL Y-10934 / UCD 77-7) TaxID=1071380 RepID=I2GWR2_HENB6|nr:hypothetical protein TBLA_0A07750 [Tetrapisispora blattae CBS 6284]CCH58564.1 hypothetical protein TBLA_0A07750 [Tetrapisispora blattae CBS 6284]